MDIYLNNHQSSRHSLKSEKIFICAVMEVDILFVVNRRDISWNIFAGEFFLFSSRRNVYYKLNQIGKDIWQIVCDCPKGIDVKSIVAKLEERYEIPNLDVAEADIEHFINKIIEQGAIQLIP